MRLVHWAVAIAFLGLLGTGLALGNAELRGIPFLGSKLIRELHLTCGVLLLVLPAVAAAWDGFIQVRDVWNKSVHFDSSDRHWLAAIAERLQSRNSETPPAGFFNAGQKLNLIVLLALALGLALTGALLAPLGPSPIPAAVRELVYPLHVVLAYCTIPLLVAHVLLATVVPGTRESLRGIVFGSVKREWARAHHARWLASLEKAPCDTHLTQH